MQESSKIDSRGQSASAETKVEPWLRGTLTSVPEPFRAVLHALEQAREDAARWCFPLTEQQLNERPLGLAPIAFHLRHIAGTLDRLLTYAEGKQLNDEQYRRLKIESDSPTKSDVVAAEFSSELDRAQSRIMQLVAEDLAGPRSVGRKQLPTTLGGLLVHIAEHTQRHIGEAIITARVVVGTGTKP